MIPAPEPATCSVKECGQPAAQPCDGCGRPYCDQHLVRLTLQRRTEPDRVARDLLDLRRVPSQTETYLVCPHCHKKPFAGKVPRFVSSRSE